MTVGGDIWTDAEWPSGWNVRHVDETGSTNADLLAAVESGTVRDRSVLAADHQTAGRGRLDRRWDAPPGANLLVSIAVAPVPAVPSAVTHRIGLAAVAAARTFRPDADIGLKWPNDVLLDGSKLAGILAQRSIAADAVVVGVGLNVGWAPEGAACLGDGIAVPRVLQALLAAIDALPSDVTAEYRRELATIGQRVRVELPAASGSSIVSGTAVDLDEFGRLVVRGDSGELHSFDVGDVVHLRPEPGESQV